MLPTAMPFQIDKPVFVKTPFQGSGKQWKIGDEFKWKELGVELYRAQLLYNQDFIHHNVQLEMALRPTVGDGLEELAQSVAGLPELQRIAREEGAKISNVPMKQVGLIRSNRLHPRPQPRK